MVARNQIFTIAIVFIFISSSILIYLSDDEDEFLTNNQSAKLTLPISNTTEEEYFNVPYWSPEEE